jgi:hypothetical protein
MGSRRVAKISVALVEVFDLFGKILEADLAQLMERVARRDGEGFNHLEIARVGERYPMLGVCLKDNYAVVQHIEDEGADTQVLMGDGCFEADAVVEFRGPDGTEYYTGEVIVRLTVASEFIREFALREAWPREQGWLTL